MLRLRKYVLTQLLPSSSASVFPLHRFISAVSPNPSSFAVKDYLVATCGLTEAQALKASAKLTHLKSPSNPDAVLAFLADLGLSGADVAALVAKDPLFLCSKVERTLGFEPAYIAHRPAMLTYSLEGRVRPRYYVVKFLKENGLLDRARDYYRAVMISEKEFVEKFISPHKESAPHLTEDYATACRGEVPARLMFA